MRRVVLEVNVYVTALLSPRGVSAQILSQWTDGDFDLVCSPLLLDELERVLRRPKFSRTIDATTIVAFLDALREDATVLPDPPAEPGVTADPNDDYLVTLARSAGAQCLVSGDAHVTTVDDLLLPVLTPRQFIDTPPNSPLAGTRK